MRSKRKSLNIPSLNIDELPIKRILLLAILAYFLIFLGAVLLTTYRMMYLPIAIAHLCSDDINFFEICVNEVIKIILFGSEWGAIKFSIYTALLTPLIYLLMVRQKGSPVSNMLALTVILLIAIAASVNPPWAELAAVLMSSLLAGCFIKKRRDKLKLG
jgi:hypothetical protein